MTRTFKFDLVIVENMVKKGKKVWLALVSYFPQYFKKLISIVIEIGILCGKGLRFGDCFWNTVPFHSDCHVAALSANMLQ